MNITSGTDEICRVLRHRQSKNLNVEQLDSSEKMKLLNKLLLEITMNMQWKHDGTGGESMQWNRWRKHAMEQV
jgi:hypothetical protein